MICEPGHLGEIAHRGLTRIVLPVGVGRERSSSVEGQILNDCAELLRIPRQPLLNSLDHVEKQHGNAAEHQHGDGIFRPAHLVILIDSGHAIEQTLDWPGNRIKERAFAIEHPCHEYAQRLCDR